MPRPIRCKIPKTTRSSPTAYHVAMEIIRPSEEMVKPRLKNFKNPACFAPSLQKLSVREMPTRRRKRAAVTLARAGQKKELPVCMCEKRERSKTKFDTSIIRTAMPRKKSISQNLSSFFKITHLTKSNNSCRQ